MQSADCFAYRRKPELVETYNGRAVKMYREECGILTHMVCRRAKDAKAACRFFKTQAEFDAGRRRYGGEKPERGK